VAIQAAGADGRVLLTASWEGLPGLGRHYLSWLEQSEATGVTTWVGGSAHGILGRVMA
jgi:hypothetical protein